MAAIGKAPSIASSGQKAAGLASDISGKYPQKAGHEDDPKDGAAKKSPAKLRDDLKKKEGHGKSPDSHLRDTLAGPIGGDPAAARFHTGPAAASAAQELQATAFTIGQDVFFGANKFDPRSRKGLGLIAHESTHVLQQTGAKQSDARFLTPRGGDEMEQEAQDAASAVLHNLGRGEALQVAEYVRNYTTESGEAVTFQDRARLDAISRLALKHAQAELRARGVRDVPPTRELKLDVSLDLTEMTDEDAAHEWGDAIVSAVTALRRPVAAPRKLVQRDTTPAPPATTPPPGPDNPETLSVKIIDPHSGQNAQFTLRHFSNTMEFELRELGVAQVRLLVRILEGAPAIASDGPDADQYGSGIIWLKATPSENTAKKFYSTMPQFKAVAAKLASERTDFLKDFLDKGQKAMLALTKESRARVVETQKKYGITKKQNTESSNVSYSYSSSNSSELDKMVEAAKKLLPIRKRLEHLMESKANLASKLHVAFTSSSQLSREEEDAKNLPDAQKEWEQAFNEQHEKFPLLSHYESASGLELLTGGESVVTQVGKRLDGILDNITELEGRLKDPATIYKLDAGFQAIKKSIKPDLTTLQLAYADMEAEDRRKAEEDLKLYLTLFTVVIGALWGGLAGAALLAAEGVVAGISTYQLIQEIRDYDLQSAAHMSDPELARCLSTTEPSLFWLVFDVVSTVVGIRANVGKMRQAVDEIRNAYKLAQAYGDAALLEKALAAHDVPAETSRKIVNTIYHATTVVAGFIRSPDPIQAFALINLFGSFWNLRTAVFRAHEEPAVLTKAKQTMQEARMKATRAALDGIKAKYPLVNVVVIDEGFENPIRVIIGSQEVLVNKVLPPEPAADGAGGGKKAPPGKTLIGSPAPDPNKQPTGGPEPGSSSPTVIGLGPNPPAGKHLNKIPDGAYDFGGGGTKPGVGGHTPGTKQGPGSHAPGAPEGPPGGGSAPADPNKTPVVNANPPPEAKPPLEGSKTDLAGGKTPLAGSKTPAQVQVEQAMKEAQAIPLASGPPAAVAGDWNILDKQTAGDRADGIAPEGAPKGAPQGTQNQQINAGIGQIRARSKGVPEYYGILLHLSSETFEVDPIASKAISEGTSFKVVLVNKATGETYIFKPAASEALLHDIYQTNHGTLMVRSRVASDLALDLHTVGDHVVPVAIVVHDGRVGSLQKFKPGTKSLAALKKSNPDVYTALMQDKPGFGKFRDNLRAFDHVINNADRDTNDGNIMVELDKDNKVTNFYAIDQDASLAPGAKIIRPGFESETLLPRSDLSQSWTDPGHPVMGKISHSLFNQMQAMVANEGSVRSSWKQAFALNDRAIDGIFRRMREVIVDYQDRLSKSKDNPGAVFYDD